MQIPRRLTLSGDALKLIAIIAMTIDHLAWLLFPGYPLDIAPVSMHIIGRLTAPIMMYFIAEGYHRTHNRKRYLARLLIFALISHIPYTMMFPRFTVIPGIPTTSVLWPLALGLLALMIDHQDVLPNSKRWQRTVLICACFAAALPSDWSVPAALSVFFMGQAHGNFKRQMRDMLLPIATYIAVYALLFDPMYAAIHIFVVLAVPLLAVYNGERGTKHAKVMKWLFYVYYPAHLLVLGLIRIFVIA
ncbi:MAG: conjugal transfer protein TraX [Propionibacteriaceae bacterium]|nr:conjugal transfer protein TraX [Propionibacteriaceae bacterium]